MKPVETIRLPGTLAQTASPPDAEEQDLTQCADFAKQMLANSAGLLIECKDPVRLDRLGRSMALTLRALPNVLVEGQDIDDTELILERFNQALATMSMSRAMSQRDPTATLTVLVRRHVGMDMPTEWQTLVRLAKDFPGANMQLLLLRASPSPMHEGQNDIFGKQMLRWNANPYITPTYVASAYVAPTNVAPTVARAPPTAAPMAPQPAPPAPGVPPLGSPAEQSLMPLSTDARGRQSTGALTGQPGRKAAQRPLAATVFVLMAVMISAAFVVSLIFPRESQALREMLFVAAEAPVQTSPAAVSTPTSVPAEAAKTELVERAPPDTVAVAVLTEPAITPQTKTEKSAPSTPALALRIPPAIAERTSSAVSPKLPASPTLPDTVEQKIKSAPIGQSTAAIAPARVESAPSATKASRDKAPAPPVPTTQVLAPEMSAAVQTVRASTDSQWFVQFAALNSYQEAQDWRSGFSLLKQALIVPVKGKTDTVFYAVIAGPFASSGEATEFRDRDGAPKTQWLRTAASLKQASLASPTTRTGATRGRQ